MKLEVFPYLLLGSAMLKLTNFIYRTLFVQKCNTKCLTREKIQQGPHTDFTHFNARIKRGKLHIK